MNGAKWESSASAPYDIFNFDLTRISRFRNCRGDTRVFSSRRAIFPRDKGQRACRWERKTDASRAREVEKFNITIPTVGNTRRLYGYTREREREEEENARITIYKRQDSTESSFSPGYWLGSNVGRGWSSFVCLCARVVVSNLNYPLLLLAGISYSPPPLPAFVHP